jgi:hypothetical protein
VEALDIYFNSYFFRDIGGLRFGLDKSLEIVFQFLSLALLALEQVYRGQGFTGKTLKIC